MKVGCRSEHIGFPFLLSLFRPFPAVMQEDNQALVTVSKLGILHQELANLISLVHAARVKVGEAIDHNQVGGPCRQPLVEFPHYILTIEQEAEL